MNKILEVTIEEIKSHQDKYILVDVREPHELVGPEGKIEGVILAPLGPVLANFLRSADSTKEYVFICRSGFRSGKACELATALGFWQVYNLAGGMLEWNEKTSLPSFLI